MKSNLFSTPTLFASLIASIAFSAFATTGCKSDGASCDDVIKHTAELMKMEVTGEMKTKALQKCEKQPAAARECAMKAQSIEALMQCK
jgi:hypothetical protein